MAVTLYRCQKCRGLFAAVFEPMKWCRDCKFQQSGYQSQGGDPAQEQIRIVDAEEDAVGGKGATIVDNQATQQSAQQLNNSLGGLQGLMGAGQQGVYSGGSEIRSPFTYSVPDNPEYKFKFTSAAERVALSIRVPADGSKVYDPDTATFFYRQNGVIVRCDGDGTIVQVISPTQLVPVSGISVAPEPRPESSPHDSILKPSRKLKFAAE